jgi:hypothetical protein
MTAKKSGQFWVRTPEAVGGACQRELRAPIWPNIHGLYETNGAETFRSKEMPYVRRAGINYKLRGHVVSAVAIFLLDV